MPDPEVDARGRAIEAVRTVAAILSLNDDLNVSFTCFPRDIAGIIVHGLQIPIVRQENLTIETAANYLCVLSGRPPQSSPTADRQLYGLLHVGPPCNAIFIRDGLPPHIENYILAHELGHFLADIFLVQQLWVRSLPERQDAIRIAFTWQALDPLLELQMLVKGLPPRPGTAIGRGAALDHETTGREIQADLIARELIAPWDEVSKLFVVGNRNEFARMLFQRFGLPLRIAAYYYDDLKHCYAPLPNVIDSLFAPLTGFQHPHR